MLLAPAAPAGLSGFRRARARRKPLESGDGAAVSSSPPGRVPAFQSTGALLKAQPAGPPGRRGREQGESKPGGEHMELAHVCALRDENKNTPACEREEVGWHR